MSAGLRIRHGPTRSCRRSSAPAAGGNAAGPAIRHRLRPRDSDGHCQDRAIWIRMAAEVRARTGFPQESSARSRTSRIDATGTAAARRARGGRPGQQVEEPVPRQHSHEIRTPLNAVIGLGYLLEQTALTDEQRQFLAKIHLRAARCWASSTMCSICRRSKRTRWPWRMSVRAAGTGARRQPDAAAPGAGEARRAQDRARRRRCRAGSSGMRRAYGRSSPTC